MICYPGYVSLLVIDQALCQDVWILAKFFFPFFFWGGGGKILLFIRKVS